MSAYSGKIDDCQLNGPVQRCFSVAHALTNEKATTGTLTARSLERARYVPVSRTRYRQNMPPGLRAQIVFAVIITLGALLVLPTALSANPNLVVAKPSTISTMPSAGSVATTVRTFSATKFSAASFSDWEK